MTHILGTSLSNIHGTFYQQVEKEKLHLPAIPLASTLISMGGR
jgi:hypothetical protein